MALVSFCYASEETDYLSENKILAIAVSGNPSMRAHVPSSDNEEALNNGWKRASNLRLRATNL